jgi:hypothetical protein
LNFNKFNWAEGWAEEYKMPAQQQALTLPATLHGHNHTILEMVSRQ